ncbi:MAG: hypothetical protein ACK5Q5_12210 [Planctomycetaceae bacterium]
MSKTLPLMILGLWAAFAPRPVAAQMWFESDYLFWGRANTSNQDYIRGGASSGDANLGVANGFRLVLGGGFGNYEVEAILSRINGWDGDGTQTFGLPIAFDGNAANTIVFPTGASSLAFNSGLALAASQSAELSEAEFLIPTAAGTHAYSSDLRDIQVNFGSHRDLNWFRWGVGYREILINENGGFGMTGVFDALDVDDAAGPANPTNDDPNNGLGSAALGAAGFTTLSGGGGFNSIDPTVPSADGLTMLTNGMTENRLDGAQLTLAARTAPNEIVTIEGFLRTGLFYNRINGAVHELLIGSGDANGIYGRTMSDSTAKASFGLNPGIRTSFNLTDYISLTAGYEMLLLTGVGLGPDQFANVQTNLLGAPTYKVEADGLFIGHGGNVGVEVRW